MSLALSIIIPVYNVPHNRLKDCIISLKKQEFDSLEFIILNDGSTDAWIDEYIRENIIDDNRFKYIQKSNTGVGDTRNKGIMESSGEYIMFVDADDYIPENACEQCVSIMRTHDDADVIIFQFSNKLKIGDRTVVKCADKDDILISIFSGNKSKYLKDGYNIDSPWAKIFKRSLISKNGIKFPEQLKRSQDLFFCLQYYEKCNRIVLASYYAYVYADNLDSVCRKNSRVMVDAFPLIIHMLEDYIRLNYSDDYRYLLAVYTKALYLMGEAETLYFINMVEETNLELAALEYSKMIDKADCITKIKQLSFRDFRFPQETIIYIRRFFVVREKYKAWLLIKSLAKRIFGF